MTNVVKLFAWFIVTALAGWSVLSLIFCGSRRLFLSETAALSYAIGLGSISAEMALLSFLGVDFSAYSILIWWVPVLLAALVLNLKFRPSAYRPDIERSRAALSGLEKFFIAGISIEMLYSFFRALIKPIESYDAIAIYALKAKIFYMARGIPHDFFQVFKDFVPHIEYPLSLPLAEAYFYTFAGSLDDILVKAIFPMYYAACLTVFYCVSRRYLARKESLLFTFLLASVPQFANFSTNGYADLMHSKFISMYWGFDLSPPHFIYLNYSSK